MKIEINFFVWRMKECIIVPSYLFFRHLKVLSLSRNRIQGQLNRLINPSMPVQKISVSYTDIAGNISEIEHFTQLRVIQMCCNQNLVGSMTHGICDLVQLKVFSVGETKISGTLPSCFGYDKNNLRFLDLEICPDLGGELPSIEDLTALEWIHLTGSNFSGPLPNILQMEELKVALLNGNFFSGPMPKGSWESMACLTEINLSQNNLSGPIPNNFVKVPNLYLVDLHKNHFTIEDGLQFQSSDLISVDFSHNPLNMRLDHFLSILPNPFTTTNKLNILNLQNCGLHGYLSSRLWDFTYLHAVQLSVNNLTGHFPEVRDDMPFLSFLNVSNNSLEGNLPSSLISLSNLQIFDITGNFRLKSAHKPIDNVLFNLDSSHLVQIEHEYYKCPAISLRKMPHQDTTKVYLDPSYYSHDDCHCDDNFYGKQGHCQKCWDSGTCSGGGGPLSVMKYPAGMYPGCGTSEKPDNGSHTSSYVFVECPVIYAAYKACNPYGNCTCSLVLNQSDGSAQTVCDPMCICNSDYNLKGHKCLYCTDTNYYKSGIKCHRCFDFQDPSNRVWLVVFIVVFVLFIVLTITRCLCAKEWVKITASGWNFVSLILSTVLCFSGVLPSWVFEANVAVFLLTVYSSKPKADEEQEQGTTVSRGYGGLLKILIFHFQTLAGLIHIFRDISPMWVFEIESAIDMANFHFTSLECLSNFFSSPANQLYLSGLPAPCLFLLTVVSYFFLNWGIKLWNNINGTDQELCPGFIQFLCKFIGILIFAVDMCFFPLIRRSVKSFPYDGCKPDKSMNNQTYMENFPTIQCESKEHTDLITASIIVLCLYFLAVLVIVLLLKAWRDQNEFDVCFSNIIAPYRKESPQKYMETIFLLTRALLAMSLSIPPNDGLIQSFLVCLVLFIAYTIQIRLRPFQSSFRKIDFENRLFEASLALLLFTTINQSLIYDKHDMSDESAPLVTVCVIFHGLFVLICLLTLCFKILYLGIKRSSCVCWRGNNPDPAPAPLLGNANRDR